MQNTFTCDHVPYCFTFFRVFRVFRVIRVISYRWIDEFRLFVHPIILGEGVPLFLHHSERTNLTFEGSQSFPSGLIELRYRLVQGRPTT